MVTPHLGRALGGFQYQVAQMLEGWLPWRITYGKWDYTSYMMAMEEAGFYTMEEYIWRVHKTVAQYITK